MSKYIGLTCILTALGMFFAFRSFIGGNPSNDCIHAPEKGKCTEVLLNQIASQKKYMMDDSIRSVFIGTSRSEIALLPSDHFTDIGQAVNISLPSLKPSEMKILVDYALEMPHVENLFLELPHIMLLRRNTVRRGMQPLKQNVLLRASVKFNEKLGGPYSIKHGKLDFSFKRRTFVDGNRVLTGSLRCRDSQKILASYQRWYEEFDGVGYQSRIAFYKSIIRTAASKAKVRILVLPIHSAAQAMRAMSGFTEHYITWLEDLADFAETYEKVDLLVFEVPQKVESAKFEMKPQCEFPAAQGWLDPGHLHRNQGQLLSLNPSAKVTDRIKALNLTRELDLKTYIQLLRKKEKALTQKCSEHSALLNNCFL